MPRGHVSTQLHSHARPQAGQGAPRDGYTRSLVTYRSVCNTCVCAQSLRQPSQGRRADPAPVFGTTSLNGQTDGQLQGHTHRRADGHKQIPTYPRTPRGKERPGDCSSGILAPPPSPPHTHTMHRPEYGWSLSSSPSPSSVFQLATSTPGAQMPCVPGASGTGPTAL